MYINKYQFLGNDQAKMKFINFHFLPIFLFIIYRLLLEYSYINFVSPVFDYEGYPLEFNLFKYIFSWVIFLSILFYLPKQINAPSTFLLVYFILVTLTPLLIFYSFANKSTFILLESIFIIPFFLSINKLPKVKIRSFKNGSKIAILLIFFFIIFGTFTMVLNGGLTYFNLDLEKVYDFREESEMALDHGIFSYLNNWLPKVFAPCLLSYLLLKKKYYFTISVFLLSIFWFSMSGHKSVLFYPFISILIFYSFRKSKSYNKVIYLFILVVFSSYLFYYFNKEEYLIPSMFIRRVFFVPSSLWFAYFEFFEQNEFVYWSNSFLSPLISYNYNVPPPKLVGDFVGTGAWANNSFIPNGYMHFGFFGIAIYGLFVCAILYFMDVLTSDNLPVWFTLSIFIVPFHILSTSSDLVTAILTHGIGLSLIFIYLFSNINFLKK
jgi:oligosaccharide repeat unit polymerase